MAFLKDLARDPAAVEACIRAVSSDDAIRRPATLNHGFKDFSELQQHVCAEEDDELDELDAVCLAVKRSIA